MAELNPPTKASNPGWRIASVTAPKPPMETPTMARFERPAAAGNLPSTSAMRSFTM